MVSPATETFIQETTDGLEDLENRLLALEDSPSAEQVDDIFRILHTIKGSGSMFGFDPLSRFTHHFETAFDLVRDGKLEMSKELIDTALASRDYMLDLLSANDEPDRIAELEDSELANNLTERITALIDEAGLSPDMPDGVTDASKTDSKQGLRAVEIVFRPEAEALKNGMRPDLLMNELAEFGPMTLTYDTTHVPSLEELDPTASYLTWRITLETSATEDELRQVFIFADDAFLEFSETQSDPAGDPKVSTEDGQGAEAVSGPAESAAAESAQGKTAGGSRSETVRVPAARLDDLMDQLGELVIAQARLDQISAQLGDQNLASIAEEVERLVTGLRDATLSMRMLPIEIVFGKFRRVVRSLSDELGKDVNLVTEGGETELDKNVIDSLTEPLVHMIRNSIDHGLETAEERIAAGKPASGSVFLGARQSGGEILVSVADDGGGLDVDAIRTRALERGLIGPGDDPSDADLHRMIFEPAFSTAKTLSSVSGRGVGMDAVRKAVTDLRGSIDVETLPGKGTRVTLRLPVTLAIIDGLLVRVDQSVFVVPLNAVSECVELSEVERRRDSGRTMLQIRNELVPFLNLDELFEFPRSTEPTRRVVIVSVEGKRVGLVVDDTLGQHQTVIKTFSRFHRDVEGFAGSTILGDGRVALILDVHALLKNAQGSSGHEQDAA